MQKTPLPYNWNEIMQGWGNLLKGNSNKRMQGSSPRFTPITPAKSYPLTSDFVMEARRNNPDVGLESQFPLSQSPKEDLPSLEAQQSATSQEVTPYNPMAAFQGSILDRNKRMDDALIQGMQNEQDIQNMNAINQVTNYNNNQQAQMNRTANSMRAGSFTPQYQQAVAYTPQSFNFGQQQAPAMTFGSVPTEGMPRGGTINGVPVFGKQGERLNVSMDALRQAGTDMQANNQFVDANNQVQTKQVKGGFTANNEFNPMMNNIGKRNIFNMGF